MTRPDGTRYRADKMSVPLQISPIERPSGRAALNSRPRISASDAPSTLGLRAYYEALFAAHGPQRWWPGRTPFEVIVGAVLVQNTSWANVEHAIENLRRQRLLTPRAIEGVSMPRLARLIRCSGYFRQKGKTLKAFIGFLRQEYHGSLAKMFRTPTPVLRTQLLSVHGIGPETADSILLYAAKHPVFVVDTYTRRMLDRHGLASPKLSYEDVRALFERNLPRDIALYNEFHALIVHTGKHFCWPREPRCGACPLKFLLAVAPESSADSGLAAEEVSQPLPERIAGVT